MQVKKTHVAKKGVIADFCDGQMYKKSILFKQHPTALKINFYFDDVEICNPLGSKRKIHKLSKFINNSLLPHTSRYMQVSSISC
jgi:hypothetical protein